MIIKLGYRYIASDWKQYKLNPDRYAAMLRHEDLLLRLEGEVPDNGQLQQLNSRLELFDEHLMEFNRVRQHFSFLYEYDGYLRKKPDEELSALLERHWNEGLELARGIRALCCRQMRTTLKLPEEDDGALLHNFFVDDSMIKDLQHTLGLTWRLGYFLHSVYMINRKDYLLRDPTFYITRLPGTPVYIFNYPERADSIKFFLFDLIAGCNMFLDNLQGYERQEAAIRTVLPQYQEPRPEPVQSVSVF
ncbi:MAG: hypothetical protein IJ228_06290 [Succinivibrio sp.]|nr:hypothetical protein [Succinivibrio sp.]